MVLTDRPNSGSEQAAKARTLYQQAGFAMIVIHTILENLYEMAGAWDAHTAAHDPEGLGRIDQVEETIRDFGVPLPPCETVQRLITEQQGASLGKAFARPRPPR